MPPPNPYEAEFRAAAAQHPDVRWWMLAGMAYETSKFRPEVRGRDGEYGIGQIMPANAGTCGVSPGDLADPRVNIACMALLLQRQFNNVKSVGGIPTWKDAAYLSAWSNNLGFGNTKPMLEGLAPPRTWARFVAKYGDSYPNKVLWVRKMMDRAWEYKRKDLVTYALVGGSVLGAGMILWATLWSGR